MERSQAVSRTARTNFYLDLFNIVPFLVLMISGLVLQVNYHMHRLPDECLVSGLSRSGWLLLHKASAVLSLIGITAHCLLHRKYIASTTERIIARRSFANVPSSMYAFILYALSSLTALIPWIFSGRGHGHGGGSHLVEIHDKLTLLLIIFTAAHIISRAGWMWKIGLKISGKNRGTPVLDAAGESEAE